MKPLGVARAIGWTVVVVAFIGMMAVVIWWNEEGKAL